MAIDAREIQDAIKKLVSREPGWVEFDRMPAIGTRPGEIAIGRPSSAASTAGARGVELVEEDASTRQYHAPHVLRSSDGIITIEVEPIQQVNLRGGGALVFAAPPPEAP